MKFALAPEHHEFFNRHGAIEFEGLVSGEQIESVREGMNQVISQRLDMSLEQVGKAPADDLFSQGRDLWRSHAAVKGLVLAKNLGEIAGGLVGKRPIRIGYDQLLPAAHQEGIHPYDHFISRQISLNEISSLQGVLCGLILCLEGNQGLPRESNSFDQESHDLFPNQTGHGVFFDAFLPIHFSQLRERPGCRYMLIVYTHSMTAYIHQPEDPHHHYFRQYGYSIGDPLINIKNPIIYR